LRQLSDEFLECARRRLRTPAREKLEAELRRATSDLYFSMFHAVCGALVEPLGFDHETPGFDTVFISTYRQPDHGRLEKHCRDAQAKMSAFADPLKQFATQLSALKNKREQADYNPLSRFKFSTVNNDLQTVESVLDRFWRTDAKQRARFAVFLAARRN
jgi:uncharacterized protein (UPF0332 family)